MTRPPNPALLGLLFIVGIAAACERVDPTIYPADRALLATLGEYEALGSEHFVSLADETEPGTRLTVMGRLVRNENSLPLAYHPILFYQADDTGSYDEAVPGDESSARLRGVVRTDSLGRFLVSTVLPGDYGSTDNNRHIHMAVSGASPEAYDFYFLQYINRGLLRWARGTDQAVVLDLKEHRASLLAATDLPVRGVVLP